MTESEVVLTVTMEGQDPATRIRYLIRAGAKSLTVQYFGDDLDCGPMTPAINI